MNYLLHPASIWLTFLQKCYYTSRCKLVQRTFRAFSIRKNPASSTRSPPLKGNNCRRRPQLFNVVVPFLPCLSFLTKTQMSDALVNDIEENITHLIVLAKIALEKGDIEKAEALLYMGLKVCEDYKIFYGLPFMYDILASIAFAQGDAEKAEDILVTVIEKMVSFGVPEDNDHIIDFKLRLARVYSSYQENLLAEIGFKTCLDLQKDKIHRGDMSTKTGMLYINILYWYAVHMIKNAKYVEAKTMLNTAHEYSGKIKGLSPYQEMVILYTLADLNMELGEYEVALDSMQSAVMLGKGISSSDLPKCYVKLAKIYVKLGFYGQARRAAEEGARMGRMFGRVETVNEAQRILEEISIREID